MCAVHAAGDPRLAGKVAFITGTATGQGRAAALLFAAEGAKVVGCDMKIAEGEETVALVRQRGGEMVATHPVDLAERDAVRAWIAMGLDAFGRMDVLYNNAAAARFAPVAEMTEADWRFTLRNELDVIYQVTSAAWPVLAAADGASIVNTASAMGLVGFPSHGGFAHAAAKGGVIALTRQLAVEGGPVGIRANSISPGTIDTPATSARLADPSHVEYVRSTQVLSRIGRPEDVAHCALFLASDEASWITGANIPVDGGLTAQ